MPPFECKGAKLSKFLAPDKLENHTSSEVKERRRREKNNGNVELLNNCLTKDVLFSREELILEDQGAVGRVRREKRRRKFSRTGERAPGMLLLTNQFHDSFECLSRIFCVQLETNIYRAAFVIFLYEGVYLQTRLFVVPVWLV